MAVSKNQIEILIETEVSTNRTVKGYEILSEK
jgi:hypothetical protein